MQIRTQLVYMIEQKVRQISRKVNQALQEKNCKVWFDLTMGTYPGGEKK